jgi:hypothetical protein
MKIIYGVLLGCLVLMVLPCSIMAGDFEGIVHMKTTHPGLDGATAMNWYIKGEKARMETLRDEGKQHFMIIDGRARTMQIPMGDKKMYMEMSIDQLGERSQEHLKEALEQHVVERTGKSEKIAGYACEVWRITDKDTKKLEQEICVAKGFGRSATFWLDPKQVQRSSQPGWVKQLVNEGGFGLRTIHYGDDGKESSRTETTAIERKSLDDALFVMPADYTKMNGEALMRGAAGGATGGGGEEVQRMMQEMKKRRAEQSRVTEGQSGGASQPDMDEMMKQLGDMMKKRPQSGR